MFALLLAAVLGSEAPAGPPLGGPTVEQVQAAAIAPFREAEEMARGWLARVRWAAWVPRLSADYSHSDRRLHVSGVQTQAEVDYWRVSPSHQIGVRLSWDLPDLLFSSHELSVVRGLIDLLKERDKAVERAIRLHYRRQRLALEARDPLELEEITAELDALTGGLYTGRVR
jgi:hypothetical protein